MAEGSRAVIERGANTIQHTSGNKEAEEEANKEAEVQVKAIREAGEKGREEVVKALLGGVANVKPQVPDRIEVPQ